MGQLSPMEANRYAEVVKEGPGENEPAITKEGGGGAVGAPGVGKPASGQSMLTRAAGATGAEESTEEGEHD